MKLILRVLVGSQAHGLATPESDFDYRGVFIAPTMDFFSVEGGKPKTTEWIEGDEDNTAYEVGHFLHLATKSNPSILEVFGSPVVYSTSEGKKMRELFPYVWSSKGVLDAFVGYSHNQQKKMLDDKPEFANRKWKYAVAYLRTLMQAEVLLNTEELLVAVPHLWASFLRDVKNGSFSMGEVLDAAHELKGNVKAAYSANPDKQTDYEPLNEFMHRMRKENL